MDQTLENWLHREWAAFKESNNRCPSKEEWIKLVHLRASEQKSLSIGISDVDEAFGNFQIEETMDEDIETKVRDAQANLNNRKYVDGSF